MKKRLYMAYGSDLNLKIMKSICPNAKVVGTSEIKEYGLIFKENQDEVRLTIEPKKGSSVPVGVWEVTENDEHNLDIYMGNSDTFYKKEFTIRIKSISEDDVYNDKKAFAYIMCENLKRGIPSLQYVSKCLQGYIEFGLDEHFLAEAQIEAEEVK